MAETNFKALDINMVHSLDEQEEMATPPIEEAFLNSPLYTDILYVLERGGYRWPPTYSIWTRNINSCIFSHSAQLTIFSRFSGPALLEPF